MIQRARAACQHQFFMEIFTIAAWEIWKQRNTKIFRGTVQNGRNVSFILYSYIFIDAKMSLEIPSLLG
uniref:Uncharacterized protein n=1 Tax=Arundo donax TaxID=35708 RepID=A0A0A9BKY2_ARUDO